MSDITNLIYVPEVTYGTTPTDDAGWKTVRFVNDNLGGQPNSTQSAENRGDREPVGQILTGLQVGGSVDCELSATTFDDFLEGLFSKAWATNVLTLGTDDISYSIQREYVTPARFALFTGMRVSSMQLNVAYGSIVTASFGFAGNGATRATTSAVGAGSVAAATTNRVLNGSNDLTVFNVDNSASGMAVRSLQLSIDNNTQARESIGALAPTNQEHMPASVTGSLDVYIDAESIDYYEEITANTAVDIDFTLSDGTNTYAIAIPAANLSGDLPGAQGRETLIQQTISFSAGFSSGAGYGIQVTRT